MGVHYILRSCIEIKMMKSKSHNTRKKILDRAAEFIQSAHTVGNETVLIVGNNDISDDSVDTVFRKFRNVSEQ